MSKLPKPQYVLMVCVDNVCRSPIAEAVMRDVLQKAGLLSEWRVDSAAIENWRLGEPPDPRAVRVLKDHQIEYHSCARRLVAADFANFDYIFAMDPSDMASLKHLQPPFCKAKLLLLSDFLFGLKPNERIIADPYYDVGEQSFEKIFAQCAFACTNFLKQARVNEIEPLVG